MTDGEKEGTKHVEIHNRIWQEGIECWSRRWRMFYSVFKGPKRTETENLKTIHNGEDAGASSCQATATSYRKLGEKCIEWDRKLKEVRKKKTSGLEIGSKNCPSREVICFHPTHTTAVHLKRA